MVDGVAVEVDVEWTEWVRMDGDLDPAAVD
jgi:hypothetical protein